MPLEQCLTDADSPAPQLGPSQPGDDQIPPMLTGTE